jgi:hypothetical protein
MVGRTVRSAREGIGSDSTDPSFVIRREARLLISYADRPIVGRDGGGRAPDARGLTRQVVSDPMRLYTLLGRDHITLLYAGNAAGGTTSRAWKRPPMLWCRPRTGRWTSTWSRHRTRTWQVPCCP